MKYYVVKLPVGVGIIRQIDALPDVSDQGRNGYAGTDADRKSAGGIDVRQSPGAAGSVPAIPVADDPLCLPRLDQRTDDMKYRSAHPQKYHNWKKPFRKDWK